MFSTLLLLLFLFFIVIPLVRVTWFLYKARRQARRFFDSMSSGASGKGRRSSEPERPVHRKKIDPSVGEYIDFEEVTVTKTSTTTDASGKTTTTTSTVTESQITDVEWEEI